MFDLIMGEALPWLVAVGAFVLSGVWAWFRGSRANEAKHVKGRLDGIKNAKKVEKEIGDADRDTVVDINSR